MTADAFFAVCSCVPFSFDSGHTELFDCKLTYGNNFHKLLGSILEIFLHVLQVN